MAKQLPAHVSTKRPIAIGLLTLFVAVALAVALFVQLSSYHLLTVDHHDRKYATVVQRTVSHDVQTPAFVMTYPVIGNQKGDGLIREYTTAITERYLQNRTPDTPKDQQLRVTYEILFYDQRTISVLFTERITQANTLLSSQSSTAVFDLTQGKRVTASDIITDTPKLTDLLYDYQRAHNTEPTLTTSELVRLLDLTPEDFPSIVPYGDKIAFSFAAHSHDPSTLMTIAISKTLLDGIVQPLYQAPSTDSVHQTASFTKLISTMPSRDQPIDPNGKKIALTFDDGPDADTPRLLDALRRYRAHATFFVVGNKASSTAPTLKRTIDEGHELGNHTWSHPYLTQLPAAQIDRQIIDTQEAIRQATGGYTPRLVRPPYGAIDDTVTAHLHGLQPILWTVDTRDWLDKDARVIYDRIMAEAKQRSIILLHDIHPTSVDAAIRAIRDLRADGWQLVTVSQL